MRTSKVIPESSPLSERRAAMAAESEATPQIARKSGTSDRGLSGPPQFVGGDDELLSPKELALLLKVTKRTIWRWLSGERLPQPIRIGGACRWRSSVIKGWLDGLQAKKRGT